MMERSRCNLFNAFRFDAAKTVSAGGMPIKLIVPGNQQAISV
jgi:hypothetical protein